MKNSRKVLVIDDESVMRDACRQVLTRTGFEVDEAESGEYGLEAVGKALYDLIILDLKMPAMDGLATLKELKVLAPETPIVVVTGYATLESGVDAMRSGASDFLAKPFTPETLRTITERLFKEKKLERENEYLRTQLASLSPKYTIIGKSEEIRAVYGLVRRVAPTDSTVLIMGESGTGKEIFARALHKFSTRADAPFVVVDCSTIVGTLFESELFGHTRGAFTGASIATHGRMEIADGGTLFFDEISNINLEMQAKLLRVIQEREFSRVGSNQVSKVDVRIIAATNRDLLEAIKAGTFREDLYYRLCVVPMMLPPLRQHKEDIPLLVEFFIDRFARERNKKVVRVSDEVMDILMAHDWPGNVRELENAIERAVILAADEVIQKDDLLYYAHFVPKHGLEEKNNGPMSLREVEAAQIRAVLSHTKGHKGYAAKKLGIDRKTLWRKIKEYNIEA